MVAAAARTGRGLASELDPGGPVGLAAGYDRDGSYLDAAARLGFGFVELGTVTPAPVPDHNPGAAVLVQRLARRASRSSTRRIAVGVNLGIQPGSPPQAAWRDYVHGMRALWADADFFVLNFTAETARALRAPCHRDLLRTLLARVRRAQESLAAASGRHVPVLVKWPVRPVWLDAARVAGEVRALHYAGMVAAFDAGPAVAMAWEAWVPRACSALARALGARAALVAVGGIDSMERALALRATGADLVEVYRGFVTRGPSLVHAIVRAWGAAVGDAEPSLARRRGRLAARTAQLRFAAGQRGDRLGGS